MTDDTLRQALTYASRGWPVFPCQPGQKIPATWHGHRDATTDPDRITAWFSLLPRWNLAVATGTPGPDVLDVDHHGAAGSGFAALERLGRAGLLDGASACVRTPRGGLHIYFTGSHQRNGHLAGQHVDFRSEGGYILAPPSRIDGQVLTGSPRRSTAPGRPGLGRRHQSAGTTATAVPARIPPGHRS